MKPIEAMLYCILPKIEKVWNQNYAQGAALFFLFFKKSEDTCTTCRLHTNLVKS